MPLAPVEYAVIAFDGTSVTGEVAPAEVAEAALAEQARIQQAVAQQVAATQPPARGERPPMDREAFKNLTTPQRIDLMEQRSAEHQARMKQRGDATKAFYAQLSAEQQKVFDQRAVRHGPRGDGPRGMHGPHGRPGDQGGPGPR